jgi:hypothetical protein
MNEAESKVNLQGDDKGIQFLLEEYRNIAATHDHMRDSINRMFYYFLLLSAVPFTVATIIFRDTEFDIHSLPPSMGWLLVIIGAGILFLSLAAASGRLRQNQYAKTVNCIRRYFADNYTTISPYLLLPTTSDLPHTRNLGHVFWYLCAMTLVGGTYECLGTFSLFRASFYIGLVAFLVYCAVFSLLLLLIFRGYAQKANQEGKDASPRQAED